MPVKHNILIVSCSVPRHDVSAGELRFYSIIRSLAETHQVTFVCPSIVKNDEPYLEEFIPMGVEIIVGEGNYRAVATGKKYLFAFVEFYYGIQSYLLGLLRHYQPECRIVIDTVDVHFRRMLNKVDITREQKDYNQAILVKKKELASYSRADLVITVTEDDADFLRKEMGALQLAVIPTVHCITTSGVMGEKNALIFVGAFNHEPNVDAMLNFCTHILPRIRQSKDVTLTIVGFNPPESIMALQNDRVRVTGYVTSTTPYLHASRVSVAPLRFGAGMKGKIGESMARGIPVVTTPVGAQGMGLVHGENVLIAETDESFAECVVDLLNNDALHSKIRINALSSIERSYTHIRLTERVNHLIDTIGQVATKQMTISQQMKFACGIFRNINWH